jgi:hypothetical protein
MNLYLVQNEKVFHIKTKKAERIDHTALPKKSIFYFSFFTVEILKGTKSGHHWEIPVASGINPSKPHQLLNSIPKIPINKPNIILSSLSIVPTFLFILLFFY